MKNCEVSKKKEHGYLAVVVCGKMKWPTSTLSYTRKVVVIQHTVDCVALCSVFVEKDMLIHMSLAYSARRREEYTVH